MTYQHVKQPNDRLYSATRHGIAHERPFGTSRGGDSGACTAMIVDAYGDVYPMNMQSGQPVISLRAIRRAVHMLDAGQ